MFPGWYKIDLVGIQVDLVKFRIVIGVGPKTSNENATPEENAEERELSRRWQLVQEYLGMVSTDLFLIENINESNTISERFSLNSLFEKINKDLNLIIPPYRRLPVLIWA